MQAEAGRKPPSLSTVWSKQVSFNFNSLVVGPIFRTNHSNLLFGSAEGKVRIWKNDQEEEVLETKGGAIQAIVLHDVTKFGATPSIDVIVGDVDGNIVIFSNFMILRRHAVGIPILSLAVEVDVAQNFSLIAGDYGGGLTAFDSNHDILWKLRLENASISCLHSVTMKDDYGLDTTYLVVGDGTTCLHLYNKGVCVKTLQIGSRVNDITSGYIQKTSSGRQVQIALGCEDGWIYLLGADYKVNKYIRVGHAITKLHALRSDSDDTQFILCCGHFDALKVYSDGELLTERQTPDWIHTISVGDVNNDGKDEIVLGLSNNSVLCLSL